MMQITRVVVGPLDTNCWVVSYDASSPVLVVDPGDDVERIADAIGSRLVAAVILTHGHFDHIGAAGDLIEGRAGVPLMVHEADAGSITTAAGSGGALFGFEQHFAPSADRLLRDGDVIDISGISVTVLHTPGHTPGGVCLLVSDPDGGPSHVFSGDTLFAGSVGRTDFPGGDGRALVRSLAEKLVALPADTAVHPGHGPDTTIGREARLNPFWPRS